MCNKLATWSIVQAGVVAQRTALGQSADARHVGWELHLMPAIILQHALGSICAACRHSASTSMLQQYQYAWSYSEIRAACTRL